MNENNDSVLMLEYNIMYCRGLIKRMIEYVHDCMTACTC